MHDDFHAQVSLAAWPWFESDHDAITGKQLARTSVCDMRQDGY